MGSGGIGSITWGGINAPGNVKSLTMMTCEESPRLVRLEEAESLKALHTYGTTGLMVEVEMRLGPKVDYDQLILGASDWDGLLGWTDGASRRLGWRKRLVARLWSVAAAGGGACWPGVVVRVALREGWWMELSFLMVCMS